MKTCKEVSPKDMLRIAKVSEEYKVLEKFCLNWEGETDCLSDLDNAIYTTVRRTEPELYDEAEKLLGRLREITCQAMEMATKEVLQSIHA